MNALRLVFVAGIASGVFAGSSLAAEMFFAVGKSQQFYQAGSVAAAGHG